MDKKKYFVTVNSGSIVNNKPDESFEFEIEATEEQLDLLQEQFEDTADTETATATHGMFVPMHTEQYNAAYDSQLSKVFRTLHELGTPETKAHIEKMNVLSVPITQA